MDQEKKQAIALMRYSAIAPLITGLSDDYKSLTAFFNNASFIGKGKASVSIAFVIKAINSGFLIFL